MKSIAFLIILILFIQCNTRTKIKTATFDKNEAKEALLFAAEQYKLMIPSVPGSLLPRNTEPDGSLHSVIPQDWTSGFYPGILWYLYQYTGDTTFKSEALRKNAILENQKHNGSTHDLGFMLYCSFGNGMRIAEPDGYRDILLTGAKTLAGRYSETTGCIKSWDWAERWQFPVIVDNMMNLEYLFWAAKTTGDSSFFHKAVSHADKTMANHYRPDFSAFHVLDYDTSTGAILEKVNHQGHSDESAWARGQAWGLYGFTMMYRETKKEKYLDHAQKIVSFLFGHQNMPENLVPYWDYDAPDIPQAPRDASSAAITASALLELKEYVDNETGNEYFSKAERILQSLSSEKYRARLGANNHFILMHSVGNLPANSEVDTPIIYADYYYIEALLRYLKY